MRVLPIAGQGADVGEPRYCEECQQQMEQGPDACLGMIPGVSHACCGHGNTEKAYAVIGGRPDGPLCVKGPPTLTFYGTDAVAFFDLVSRGGKTKLRATMPSPSGRDDSA